MGTAASVQEVASQHPEIREVLTSIQQLRRVLEFLVSKAVEPGTVQNFFNQCTSAQLEQWLLQNPSAPDDTTSNIVRVDVEVEVATLSLTTRALDGVINLTRGDKHQEMPEGALRDFDPVGHDPKLNELMHNSSVLSKNTQYQLQRNPGDLVLVGKLTKAADELESVMRQAVKDRCQEKDIAKRCHAAVAAANDNFKRVYDVIWTRVADTEADGCKLYQQAVTQASFPASKYVQEASHPVALLVDATNVKPKYDIIVYDIVGKVHGVTAKVPRVRVLFPCWGVLSDQIM